MRLGWLKLAGFLLVLPAPLAAQVGAPHAHEQAEKPAAAPIKVHDAVVLTLDQPHAGRLASDRARAASTVLTAIIESKDPAEARVERRGDTANIWAGKTLVLEVTTLDAGATPLDIYAAGVAAKVHKVIIEERRRREIADTAVAISFVVFFALIALYALRKTGEAATRAYAYLSAHGDRIPGIEFQSFEVVGPRALRSGLLALVAVGRYVAQIAILYVWLVFALSLFETTRPLTERLTNYALKPLTELAVRLAATLPIALVALVFGVVVYVLVRFTRLFFASVASGETKLDGVPRDLAAPTGMLASIGIVLFAIVSAGPLVTGASEGALARAGGVVLLAIGLASTPLLASALIGARLVFTRRLPKGEHVEVRGRIGRIREVTLLELRLIDEDGGELRVPHFMTLVTPLRVLGRKPRVCVELSITPAVAPSEVIALLTVSASVLGEVGAAGGIGGSVSGASHGGVRVQLIDIDAQAAVYRVTLAPLADKNESDVRLALVNALSDKGIALAARSARLEAQPVS
jgi:small-conductance mechanosensitive channel